MERVPALMEERPYVVIAPDGVHEDERPAPLVQRALVSAGRLALTALQVEQLFVPHELELVAKRRVDTAKDLLGPAYELLRGLERPQRRPAERIDQGVPGPQARDVQRPTATLVDAGHQRQHHLLDARVKLVAVFGSVVEPAPAPEDVVAIVGEVRVARDLRAQRDHLVVENLHGLPVLEPAAGDELPDLLADCAVRLLQELRRLLERELLPVV